MYKNIYYTPEAFGLVSIFDVDKSDGCYQFDMFVIWQALDRYYWASDSGCSCPEPFENVDLSNARQGTLRDAVNDALVWVDEDDWRDEHDLSRARESIKRFAKENGL